MFFQDAQALVTSARVQARTWTLALAAVSGVNVVTIPSERGTWLVRALIGAGLAIVFGGCRELAAVALGHANPVSTMARAFAGLSSMVVPIFAIVAFTSEASYSVIAATNQGPAQLAAYGTPAQAQALAGALMHALTQPRW